MQFLVSMHVFAKPVIFTSERFHHAWRDENQGESRTKLCPMKRGPRLVSAEMIGKLAARGRIRFSAVRPHSSRLSGERWYRQIRNVWAKGATNTFELAMVVCQARQTLQS